jgi:expansin (peptidoglycan-binding protein)
MFGNTNRITVPEIPLYTVTPATTRATTRLYTPTDIKAFLDLKAFIELLDLVNGYLYTELRNDFDFELDGVPVQVNGNYMRIGNTLLPTYGNTVAKATGYFDTMSKDELELTVKALLKICDENDIKVGIRRA